MDEAPKKKLRNGENVGIAEDVAVDEVVGAVVGAVVDEVAYGEGDEEGRDKEAKQAARRVSLNTSKDNDDWRSLVRVSTMSSGEHGNASDWNWVWVWPWDWPWAWDEFFVVGMDESSGTDMEVVETASEVCFVTIVVGV